MAMHGAARLLPNRSGPAQAAGVSPAQPHGRPTVRWRSRSPRRHPRAARGAAGPVAPLFMSESIFSARSGELIGRPRLAARAPRAPRAAISRSRRCLRDIFTTRRHRPAQQPARPPDWASVRWDVWIPQSESVGTAGRRSAHQLICWRRVRCIEIVTPAPAPAQPADP